MYFGGMRNPKLALRKLTVLQEAGRDVARMWRNLVKNKLEALEAARTFGADRCQLDESVINEWSDRLAKLWRVPKVSLRSRHQFTSPLQAAYWEAWRKFSKDPEPPLIMASAIPSSNGVFPPISDEALHGVLQP